MVRDDFWKLIITYVTSFCMLAGGLHWAFFFTILGSMTAFDVYAVDEIKQRLETTYELEEAKNVDGTEIYNKILDRNDQSTNNPYLEQKILNKDYGVGKTIELDQYPDVDFATEYKAYLDDGLGAKQQGKVPSMTNGNVDVQYYEKSSVTLARDKEGKIVTTVVPVDERGELKTSLEAKEAFSSQINRSDAEFNAPQNYGDENAYLNDMKRQYLNAGNAKTMESEAYRSIIKANNDNPAQRLKSNAYFLTQGNNALGDARDGKGIWAQTCKDETITEKEIVQVPVWEPQVCQKPNHQNFNFCEVTRTLKDNPYFERVNVSAKFGHSWGHRLTIEADFVTGTGKILSDSQPAKGEEGVVYAESIEKVDYDLFCSSGTGTFNLLSSTSWPGAKLNSDHDTTDYYRVVQEPSCSNGLKAILQVEDTFLGSYKDSWDLTAHFYFEFQTAQYVSEYTQNPKNCASQLGWKPGPYPCVGESCFKESAPKNEFCTFDEWEVIKQDTGNYPQWVIEGISQMFPNDPNPDALYGGDNNGEGQYHVATWKINAKGYSCDPLKQNDFCVQVLNKETEEFEEQCFNYEEFKQLKGSCHVYEDNSRCELVGKTCVEGWHDTQNDVCYMYSDSYRCDVSKPYEKTTTKTNNVCAGMLPCLGDDCDYGDEESSDDFENAVLMASISQTVADDSNCVNKDPNTCEIFPGEQEYCSWEVSGLGNNCCDAPSGINYIEMAMLGYKMMQTETFKTVSSTLSGGFTDKVGGMYSDFSAMLVDGWNTGSKVVVDFASSVMGDPEFMSGVAESVTTGGHR
ncbi:conjugal transfer protein TraN (plasmid) [Shewanella sp. HL-SH4]|uniref:conjugal transfer protein TraN n=1 Tax=Shewanella sp. HL-SH4 TaxID=3436240 RepID=UPI003EBE17E7